MEEQTSKKIEFDITMNAKCLYDYLMYHAYSGAGTLLASCIGAMGIILGLNYGYTIYVILGVVIILYTPFNLRLAAARSMTMNETYKKPLHYVLDEQGITVSQGDVSDTISWDKCTKAASTRRSIILYTGKNNACVFPRVQLEENVAGLIATIASNMEPKKVKIRY